MIVHEGFTGKEGLSDIDTHVVKHGLSEACNYFCVVYSTALWVAVLKYK